MENSSVVERAIDMLPFLKPYVEKVAKNPPASDNFKKLKTFLGDKLLHAKLGFFKQLLWNLRNT